MSLVPRFGWTALLLLGLPAAPLAGNSGLQQALNNLEPLTFQLQMQATINSTESLLQVTEHIPMSFGSFLPVASGSISVSPEGAITFGGDYASEAAFHEGDHNPGEMELSGIPGQQVHLQLEASSTTLEGPGEPMMISGIQFLDGQGNALDAGDSFRFDGDGQASLRYGATLTFTENQTPGVYEGETQITMNY